MPLHTPIQQVADDLQILLMLPVPAALTYDELVGWLTSRVELLLKEDFNKLVHLLYRVDVSEEKLRYLLATNKGEMAASIIAKLMIERQVQKIETRRLFTTQDDDCGEEKW